MSAAQREHEHRLAELQRALHESELRFEAIVGELSDPVTIRNHEHQLIYANRAALAHMGFESLEELRATGPLQIMAEYRVLDAGGREISTEELPSVRILDGKPAEPLLIHTVHRRTGAERWNLLKAAPLLGPAGQVSATIMIIEDVTEQQRAERHSEFLVAAGQVLASSLDYERTLRNVAELAVPDIADWCAVDLLDEDGDRVSVAVAHSDPARLELAEELRRYEPAQLDPGQGLGLVLRTGRPAHYPEIPDELLARTAVSARHLELIRAVGMRSALIVPMRIADRTLGAMTLVNAESGRTLGPRDIALTEQLAARAALAIENSRLYSQRSQIAHTLQQSLLPRRLPEIPGYRLASAYTPAVAGTEVGGDFYDAWPAGDRWLVVIGDVTGKGVDAAALTAQVRHTLRASSMFLASPAQLIGQLDRILKEQPEPGSPSVCTVVCLALEPHGAEVVVAVGGHPLPLRVGATGVQAVGGHGPLVGGLAGASWTDHPVALRPGDTLLLYTDGVTDAIDSRGERYGLRRLEQTLLAGRDLPTDELVQRLTNSVSEFEHGSQADDKAVIALTRTAADELDGDGPVQVGRPGEAAIN